MARPLPATEIEFPGADSFLDVVTNIVGILIILIVVIAVRAKSTPVSAAEMGGNTDHATGAALQQNVALENDIHDLVRQIESVKHEAAVRANERDAIATILTAAQRDVAEQRAKLNEHDKAEYDRRSELAILKSDLNRINVLQTNVEETGPPSVVIENLPTPLARVVDDHEIHFQLRGGKITYVPLTELLEKLIKVFRDKAERLRDQDEYVDTIGPVDNFHCRYRLVKKEIPWDQAVRNGGHGGVMVMVERAEFIPSLGQQGEDLQKALSNLSAFRARLDETKPGRWTVTLWVYPDSFNEFRALRKELYKMGYAVAGRPIPLGESIAASPSGSKSAAE